MEHGDKHARRLAGEAMGGMNNKSRSQNAASQGSDGSALGTMVLDGMGRDTKGIRRSDAAMYEPYVRGNVQLAESAMSSKAKRRAALSTLRDGY